MANDSLTSERLSTASSDMPLDVAAEWPAQLLVAKRQQEDEIVTPTRLPPVVVVPAQAVDARAPAVEPPPIVVQVVAELPAESASEGVVAPAPNWPRSWPMKSWRWLGLAATWTFALASLLATLAVLAAIPVVQFVSLGYLLEASGRVSRSGRLRDGFIDFGKFARIGSLVLGTWLVLLPIRVLSNVAHDAYLIDPTSPAVRAWRFGLIVATTFGVAHILLAWYSGGRLRHFIWPLLAPFQLGLRLVLGTLLRPILRPTIAAIWPALADDLYALRPLTDWFPPAILWAGIRRGHMYAEARDAVWDFCAGLQLPHYFWLGLRGTVGALVWLFIPVLLLMAGTVIRNPIAPLFGWIGALLLTVVLLYLPFLQAHFAAKDQFSAMFQWRTVRQAFRRAPIAFWFSLTITCLFALPLYLLKIEATPREVTWLPSLFFVIFIYPARLLSGWAMGRALHRELPRFFMSRWVARLAAIPVVLFYVLIVFLTQYTSWYGPVSLFEQHAFLVPVPFLGL